MGWPLISVVVTGYRRPDLLRESLESFLDVMSYPRNRLELILCDDGSPPEMQEQMRKLPFDQFCFGKKNEGLAKPANRGLKAAKAKYILQLQDDWRCQGPPDFLQAGLEILHECPDVGMISYRKRRDFPSDECITRTGRKFIKFHNGEPEVGTASGHYPYTHNPHLKRRGFHDLLGYYPEDIPMWKMELAFCRRVAAQDVYRIAYINGYDVFVHTGEGCSYNPLKKRARLRERLLANPLTRLPMKLYLTIKHRGEDNI